MIEEHILQHLMVQLKEDKIYYLLIFSNNNNNN